MDKKSLSGQVVLLAEYDPVQLSLTGFALRQRGAKVYAAPPRRRCVVVVIAILTLLGPSIGNVFSTVTTKI